MYKLVVKDKGPDISLMLTRALLAISAMAAFVYTTGVAVIVNYSAAVLLLAAALFTNKIIHKFHLHKLTLVIAASVILFIATHSIAFTIVLLFYGSILKFLHKTASVEISDTGVSIDKLFSKPVYLWASFSNVILKDNLLTLDFKNNKILQLELEENAPADEKQFNDFCNGKITQ